MDNKNYSVWESPIYNKSQFKALNTYEQLKYLSLLGSLAPSTHNTQPWRFKIDSDKKNINIYVDKKYILPASDVAGRQTAFSIGCAIKNIKISAEYFGLSVNIEILSQNKEDWKPLSKEDNSKTELMHVATLNFIELDNTQSLSFNPIETIFKRRAIRAEYDPHKKIEDKIIEQIKNISSSYTNLKIHLVTDSIRKLTISEFQGQADSFVINSKKFSKELGDWLLPNNTNSQVGMPGVGFGLQDQEAERMHKGLTGQQKLEPEDGLRFSLAGKTGIEKSPLICFITGEKDDVINWISAGELFEEIFLMLTSENINVAVHAGIVEVALINQMFATTLGTTRKILSLFRVGHTKKAEDANRPHSPRYTIEQILINK